MLEDNAAKAGDVSPSPKAEEKTAEKAAERALLLTPEAAMPPERQRSGVVSAAAALDDESVMLSLPEACRRKRWLLYALTNGALFQEFLFLFFQYQATSEGLAGLGVDQRVAKTLALPLSLADWVVNVLSVSVPADADSVLFPVKEQLAGRWALLESMIKGVSFVGSYSVGAAADALPLLALVPQDWEPWQTAMLNYTLILANILPGATYYRLFNHAAIARHMLAFKDFSEHPTRFFQRFYQKPVNFLCHLEVLRSWIAVTGYRALNFAFIAQALGPYILAPLELDRDKALLVTNCIALAALTATAVNVMSSRLLPTYEHLASLGYDVVSHDEYHQAAQALRRHDFATRWNTGHALGVTALAWLPSVVTATGWAWLTHSLLEYPLQQYMVAAAVGSASLLNSIYVEHYARVSKKAVAMICQQTAVVDDDDEIDRRVNALYGVPHFHHVEPVALEAEQATQTLATRLVEVTNKFEALIATFASTNRWLGVSLVAVNLGARAARSIGFYGFIKTLATTLGDYTGLEVTDEQILALCLVLAPETFKNEVGIFDTSMKHVIQGWQAKCYMEKRSLGRSLSSWEAIQVCLRKSPYDFSLREMDEALTARLAVAAPLNPAPVIVVIEPMVAEDHRTPLLAATTGLPSQGSPPPLLSSLPVNRRHLAAGNALAS